MPRSLASFRRNLPRRRIGAVLVLVALVLQLAFPGVTAFAHGADPLGLVPICSHAPSGAGDTGGAPGPHRKMLHAACPLCQAPSVGFGFLPPPEGVALVVPGQTVRIVWSDRADRGASGAVVGLRARGPPGAA